MNPFLAAALLQQQKAKSDGSSATEIKHIRRVLWLAEAVLLTTAGRAVGFCDSEVSTGTGSRPRIIRKVAPHFSPALPSPRVRRGGKPFSSRSLVAVIYLFMPGLRLN